MIELLCSWGLWVMLNMALMISVPYLPARESRAFTNGISIVIPAWMSQRLSTDELAAVVAHERGHIAHLHAWKNLTRICFFRPTTQLLRCMQELEADDYAADHGHARALATALRILSNDPFVEFRARRLDERA